MALKKLSDPYIIRAQASVPTLTAGASPAQTGLSSIDTGLDSLRREVLAVWSVQFGYTGSDDNVQMEAALKACRDAIVSGADDIGCRYGITMSLNSEPQGLVETFNDPHTIAVDSYQVDVYGYDMVTGSNHPAFVTESTSFRFPEIYDPNEPKVPLAWVTSSQMELAASAFIDGVTTTLDAGGITGSCRIIAQRYQADASLFASILTGNN